MHAFFTELTPRVGTGTPPHQGWRTIGQVPLVILVGVTGVGKSTSLQALRDQGLSFHLLPDRRVLTDELIIAFLQRQAGATPCAVADRAERFALTRRYREQFPGGMSHALSQLYIQQDMQHGTQVGKEKEQQWWIFDGLRGANEVAAAATALPKAHFVVLDAPDLIRVQRLLGRSDAFDRIAIQNSPQQPDAKAHSLSAIGIPEAEPLFTASEVHTLLALCAAPIGGGDLPVDELRAKLKIVVEERRSYDPAATIQTLQDVAPTRTLIIDTTTVSAVAAAQQIIHWLPQQSRMNEA